MFTQSAARALAVATLFGSLVLAGNFAIAAPATTEPALATAKASPVEARIKELRNKLNITDAQQAQWDSLVQVIRDNAKAMTAIDAVKSYQAVIEAHEAGMAKFVPAFQALYDSMSPAQKETADAMFRSRVRTAADKKNT